MMVFYSQLLLLVASKSTRLEFAISPITKINALELKIALIKISLVLRQYKIKMQYYTGVYGNLNYGADLFLYITMHGVQGKSYSFVQIILTNSDYIDFGMGISIFYYSCYILQL